MSVNSFRLNLSREREMRISLGPHISLFAQFHSNNPHRHIPSAKHRHRLSHRCFRWTTELSTLVYPTNAVHEFFYWGYSSLAFYVCLLFRHSLFPEFWISQSNNFYLSNRKNSSESCASVQRVKQRLMKLFIYLLLLMFCKAENLFWKNEEKTNRNRSKFYWNVKWSETIFVAVVVTLVRVKYVTIEIVGFRAELIAL